MALNPQSQARQVQVDPHQVLSVVLYWLLISGGWVHRRVETCEFLTEDTVRRRVSIDFTLPTAIRFPSETGTTTIRLPEYLPSVPVGLLKKEPLHAFSLRDEDGRPLPVMTTRENGRRTGDALLAYAAGALNKAPQPGVAADIRKVAQASGDEVGDVLRRMELALSSGPADRPRHAPAAGVKASRTRRAVWARRHAQWERRQLMRDDIFPGLITDLAANFVLLADHDVRTGERRILKFEYEHRVEANSENAFRWLGIRFGVLATTLRVPCPGASRAESYHCEVPAPAGLEITRAYMATSDRPLPSTLQGGALPRAHVHVESSKLPRDAEPEMVLHLRTERSGFLRPALLTCVVTAALLVVGRMRLDEISFEVEAASTLLLLVPGLLAVYLSRPSEHALASSLFVGVRLMLALVGLCAIFAGALLVARVQPEDREFWWSLLTVMSLWPVVIVSFANVLPTKGKTDADLASSPSSS